MSLDPDSPLNARPGTQWHTSATKAVGNSGPSQEFDTAAVPQDRSDVTVVADLMAETGGSDDDPSLAAAGESVMIDLADDDDDDAPRAAVTISTMTDADVSCVEEAEDAADAADTRLIGPWTRKPPPPRE